MRRSRGDFDVVVVGAGPVGLAAALAVRRRGLSALVVERRTSSAPREGSRAIFVHGRSLDLLERLSPGSGRCIAAYGTTWRTKRTTWRGRDVFSRTYAGAQSGSLPASTSLAQTTTERILLDAAAAAGVNFEWGACVQRTRADESGVVVESSHGSASAAYVIAADGGDSTIRTDCGARLEGARSAIPFLVVDVVDDPESGRAPERVFHYEHPAVGGRNVLVVPYAGGLRVDIQGSLSDSNFEFGHASSARAAVAAVLGDAYAERLKWVSVYTFQQAVASRFVDPGRRLLLAGDAAHLFSPFGARGMNSGFFDADAAAAAIAVAVQSVGREREQVIDAYDVDRRAAAERNRAAARRALAHMHTNSRLGGWQRSVVARIATLGLAAGSWLDAGPYGPRLDPRLGY